MKRLAILGASGQGKVVADIAELTGWDEVVFFDDAWPTKTILEHWSILGTFEDLLYQNKITVQICVAIGNNAIRETKIEQLVTHKFDLPVSFHPSATVSKYATLKLGSIMLAGSVINLVFRYIKLYNIMSNMNPDEYLDADLKNCICSAAPARNMDQFKHMIVVHMRKWQKHPKRAKRYFRHRDIAYAA